MANKRIYELTDEQTDYSEDLEVAVSTSSFTSGDKRMKLKNIFAKTFGLTAVGNYNPVTTVVRVSPSTGLERKVTVKNLLEDADTVALLKTALGTDTSDLAFTGTPDSNYTSVTVNGKKYGNVRFVSGQFSATVASPSSLAILKNITGYVSPGFTVFFVCAHDTETITEGGYGQITADGDIFVSVGHAGIWRFQATIISDAS